MRLPVVQGVIERRILVNYRVAPERLRAVLPPRFEPVTVRGFGLAGICLIRLAGLRPRWLPAAAGLESENAAHRIAVRWQDANGAPREGVYVLRRDSTSRLSVALGGRVFPGVHHHARFAVRDDGQHVVLSAASDDGAVRIAVDARRTGAWPATSVFQSLDEASRFFAAGSLGYSEGVRPGTFDGLELRTAAWRVEPLEVASVASNFFDDPARFPPGTAALDCALVMRGIPHEWHERAALVGATAPGRTIRPA